MEIKTIKVGALPSPNSFMRLRTQIKHVEFVSTCCDEQLAKQNLQNILNGVCNDVYGSPRRGQQQSRICFLNYFGYFISCYLLFYYFYALLSVVVVL